MRLYGKFAIVSGSGRPDVTERCTEPDGMGSGTRRPARRGFERLFDPFCSILMTQAADSVLSAAFSRPFPAEGLYPRPSPASIPVLRKERWI